MKISILRLIMYNLKLLLNCLFSEVINSLFCKDSKCLVLYSMQEHHMDLEQHEGE